MMMKPLCNVLLCRNVSFQRPNMGIKRDAVANTSSKSADKRARYDAGLDILPGGAGHAELDDTAVEHIMREVRAPKVCRSRWRFGWLIYQNLLLIAPFLKFHTLLCPISQPPYPHQPSSQEPVSCHAPPLELSSATPWSSPLPVPLCKSM